MGKKQRALDEMQRQLMAQIADLKKPENNPAQQYLTNEALSGAEYLKKGDYSALPKGMFFDFKTPIEDMKQFDSLNNVGKEGTYALGDTAGAGKAQALAGDYRKNLFARDTSNNYQTNISNAATNIRGGLGAASQYKTGQDAQVVAALQNMYGALPKPGTPFWQQLLLGGVQAGGQVGAAAMKGA